MTTEELSEKCKMAKKAVTVMNRADHEAQFLHFRYTHTREIFRNDLDSPHLQQFYYL